LKDEVEDECRRYGDVDKLIIDYTNINEGYIYVRFKNGKGAENAIAAFANRFFSGKKIIAYCIPDMFFQSKVR